jgi:hypothetical protein
MVVEQYSRARSAVLAAGINWWSTGGEFVADGFEALPHRDLLIGVQLVKSAGFGGADEVGECGIETIEGFIHHRALVAFWCCGVPEFHASIY